MFAGLLVVTFPITIISAGYAEAFEQFKVQKWRKDRKKRLKELLTSQSAQEKAPDDDVVELLKSPAAHQGPKVFGEMPGDDAAAAAPEQAAPAAEGDGGHLADRPLQHTVNGAVDRCATLQRRETRDNAQLQAQRYALQELAGLIHDRLPPGEIERRQDPDDPRRCDVWLPALRESDTQEERQLKGLLLPLYFWLSLTRGFANAARQAINVTQQIAGCLARMDIDEASELLERSTRGLQ
eukprot:gene38790-48113_t